MSNVEGELTDKKTPGFQIHRGNRDQKLNKVVQNSMAGNT